MQTITKFLHLACSLEPMVVDAEYQVDRVCKEVLKSFTPDEVAFVEAFLADLCDYDLRLLFDGEGQEVADLYERLALPDSKQELVEEMLNFTLLNI